MDPRPRDDAALGRAVREHTALNTFVDVSLSGMYLATDAAASVDLRRQIARVLQEPDPFPTEDEFNKRKQEAKTLEDFAREQAAKGFPYLFALATVRLWSILEVMVEDLVIVTLERSDRLPTDGLLSRLEGPLLPFLSASDQERAECMTLALEEKVRAVFKPGVARFEALLEPLGLHGQVEEAVRRVLLELSSVRNLLVHKNGIVDRRFAEACPWLNWKPGREVTLTRNYFRMYGLAVDWYILELDTRLRRKSGSEPDERALQIQAALLTRLTEFLETRPAGT